MRCAIVSRDGSIRDISVGQVPPVRVVRSQPPRLLHRTELGNPDRPAQFELGLGRGDPPSGAARRASNLSPCGRFQPASELSHTPGFGPHAGVRERTREAL